MNTIKEEDIMGHQQIMNMYVILEPQGVEVTSLYDVVDRYRRGILALPPHQRDPVWKKEKKKRWISRIKDSKLRPVGMISTYQLDNGKQSPTFINDGSQRIRATLEYLENSRSYGDSPSDAERYIRACRMPVQHSWYKEHDKALVDFQLLNLGTYLTPYELCKGVLTYMENSQWGLLLDELHIVVREASLRVLKHSRYKPAREEYHKFLRNDYALFHRFLTRDRSAKDYDVSKGEISFEDVHNKKVTEWRLRIALEESTPEQIAIELKTFASMIDRETTLIANIWYDELDKLESEAISPTCYRWIVHCAIWKRNNKIPNNLWEKFLKTLLKTSNGKSQIKVEFEGEVETYTLSLSAMGKLRGVCRIIDMLEFYEFPSIGKRKRKQTNLKEGADQSHLFPVSLCGEGPTIPEPAGRNRARGAKPIFPSSA